MTPNTKDRLIRYPSLLVILTPAIMMIWFPGTYTHILDHIESITGLSSMQLILGVTTPPAHLWGLEYIYRYIEGKARWILIALFCVCSIASYILLMPKASWVHCFYLFGIGYSYVLIGIGYRNLQKKMAN